MRVIILWTSRVEKGTVASPYWSHTESNCLLSPSAGENWADAHVIPQPGGLASLSGPAAAKQNLGALKAPRRVCDQECTLIADRQGAHPPANDLTARPRPDRKPRGYIPGRRCCSDLRIHARVSLISCRPSLPHKQDFGCRTAWGGVCGERARKAGGGGGGSS